MPRTVENGAIGGEPQQKPREPQRLRERRASWSAPDLRRFCMPRIFAKLQSTGAWIDSLRSPSGLLSVVRLPSAICHSAVFDPLRSGSLRPSHFAPPSGSLRLSIFATVPKRCRARVCVMGQSPMRELLKQTRFLWIVVEFAQAKKPPEITAATPVCQPFSGKDSSTTHTAKNPLKTLANRAFAQRHRSADFSPQQVACTQRA